MHVYARTLIDGTGGPVRENVRITVEGDRIRDVADGVAPPDASGGWIEAGPLTVLPGLINCHEHFSYKGRRGTIAEIMGQDTAVLAVQGAVSARWDVGHGITSIRSCADKDFLDVKLARLIERGITPGPRVMAAGPPLMITGGHGYPVGWEVDGPENVRGAGRRLLKNGSDLIKVIASGGIATTRPGEQALHVEFTLPELRAAVEVAHEAERRVAAHAHGPRAIDNILEAGVDSVEHGTLITREQARRMAESGTFLVPTMSALYRYAFRGVELGRPASSQASARALYDEAFACLQGAIEAGTKVVAGTDSLGDLVEEIELLVQAGSAPAEAIRSATGLAGELLGLPVGTVAPGQYADLIFTEGDPLADAGNLRNVRTVVKGGEVVWTSSDGFAFDREPAP